MDSPTTLKIHYWEWGNGPPLVLLPSMLVLARTYAPLVRELGLQRVPLIGHSNSGPVATITSVLFPDKISALILADSTGGDRHPSLLKVIFSRALDCLLEPRLTLRAAPHLLLNLILHARNLLHQISLTGHYDLSAWASQVQVPTLLAWGKKDHTMPLKCAYHLQRLIPQVQIHIHPKGSHDWPIVHPRSFAKTVGEFAVTLGLVSRHQEH